MINESVHATLQMAVDGSVSSSCRCALNVGGFPRSLLFVFHLCDHVSLASQGRPSIKLGMTCISSRIRDASQVDRSMVWPREQFLHENPNHTNFLVAFLSASSLHANAIFPHARWTIPSCAIVDENGNVNPSSLL